MQQLHKAFSYLKSFKLPPKVREIMISLRMNRPASLLMMLWPMLWGFFTANGGTIFALIPAIALIIAMRGASLLYEDLSNKNIELNPDPYAPTEEAPQPSVLALFALSIATVALAHAIGTEVLLMVILWGVLVVGYPYLYKVTWFPQFYAGLIFGGLPVLIGQAIGGEMTPSAIVLFAVGFFWVTGIETLRADIKVAQDSRADLKSIILMLGEYRIPFMSGCFILTQILLILTGIVKDANGLYYAALMLAQGILSHAYYGIQLEEKQTARLTFRRTALAGLIATLGFVLGM